MIDPPFLELSYYMGVGEVDAAFQKIAPKMPALATGRRLDVPGLIGLTQGEELLVDRGTLLLRTTGAAFSGPQGKRDRRLASHAKRVYEQFIKYATLLNPRYGAILVEVSLDEPEDLRRDPVSVAFCNFYLGRRCFGDVRTDRIVALVGADVYVERTDIGAYVSMSPELNPESRGIDPVDAQYRSARVSQYLATISSSLAAATGRLV